MNQDRIERCNNVSIRGVKYKYRVSGVTGRNWRDHDAWLETNCRGRYLDRISSMWFARRDDATLFALTFT